MEGVDLYAVVQILGHKTPRMTQRYAHFSPTYMAGAVSKMDGIWAECGHFRLSPRPIRIPQGSPTLVDDFRTFQLADRSFDAIDFNLQRGHTA